MTGKINSWKQILNTLSIHYGDRITAVTNQLPSRPRIRVRRLPILRET